MAASISEQIDEKQQMLDAATDKLSELNVVEQTNWDDAGGYDRTGMRRTQAVRSDETVTQGDVDLANKLMATIEVTSAQIERLHNQQAFEDIAQYRANMRHGDGGGMYTREGLKDLLDEYTYRSNPGETWVEKRDRENRQAGRPARETGLESWNNLDVLPSNPSREDLMRRDSGDQILIARGEDLGAAAEGFPGDYNTYMQGNYSSESADMAGDSVGSGGNESDDMAGGGYQGEPENPPPVKPPWPTYEKPDGEKVPFPRQLELEIPLNPREWGPDNPYQELGPYGPETLKQQRRRNKRQMQQLLNNPKGPIRKELQNPNPENFGPPAKRNKPRKGPIELGSAGSGGTYPTSTEGGQGGSECAGSYGASAECRSGDSVGSGGNEFITPADVNEEASILVEPMNEIPVNEGMPIYAKEVGTGGLRPAGTRQSTPEEKLWNQQMHYSQSLGEAQMRLHQMFSNYGQRIVNLNQGGQYTKQNKTTLLQQRWNEGTKYVGKGGELEQSIKGSFMTAAQQTKLLAEVRTQWNINSQKLYGIGLQFGRSQQQLQDATILHQLSQTGTSVAGRLFGADSESHRDAKMYESEMREIRMQNRGNTRMPGY